jgi:hypothetical protein
LRKLRIGKGQGLSTQQPTTTALGDWFVRPYNRGRHRLLLCTSSNSRLTLVIAAKDLPAMPQRIAAALDELLFALGVDVAVIANELGEMASWEFAPSNDASVLGTMTDMATMADAYLDDRTIPSHLLVAEMRLAEVLCGPLKYAGPRDVSLALLRRDS